MSIEYDKTSSPYINLLSFHEQDYNDEQYVDNYDIILNKYFTILFNKINSNVKAKNDQINIDYTLSAISI